MGASRERTAGTASPAGAGDQPGAGDLPGGRRGAARLGWAGDGADRAGVAPRGGVDRLGDERAGRGGLPRPRRARVPRALARGRRVPGAPGGERPRGVRPLLQRVREPDAVVHPALPVGPVQRPGHPPPRDRGVRVRLQRRQRGPRARRGGGAGGQRGAGGDGARLPPVHAPRPRAPSAPGRVSAPLHPYPLDAVRRVAGAALADSRGDLRGPAGERHHRLPHALLPAQLPAVLRGFDGSRGGLRARHGALRRARGVGARVPAADRPPRDPADRRSARACRSWSASCWRAAGTS